MSKMAYLEVQNERVCVLRVKCRKYRINGCPSVHGGTICRSHVSCPVGRVCDICKFRPARTGIKGVVSALLLLLHLLLLSRTERTSELTWQVRKTGPVTSSETAITLECCEIHWTSPGGNTPQGINCTATCLLSRKLFKLDDPDTQDTAGEARTSSSLMYSYGLPNIAKQKQDDQLEHIYSSYVRIRDVALKTCQRWWMIGRSGERVRDIRASGTTWWWWYIYVCVCVCARAHKIKGDR